MGPFADHLVPGLRRLQASVLPPDVSASSGLPEEDRLVCVWPVSAAVKEPPPVSRVRTRHVAEVMAKVKGRPQSLPMNLRRRLGSALDSRGSFIGRVAAGKFLDLSGLFSCGQDVGVFASGAAGAVPKGPAVPSTCPPGDNSNRGSAWWPSCLRPSSELTALARGGQEHLAEAGVWATPQLR